MSDKPTLSHEDKKAKLRIEHETLRAKIESDEREAALATDAELDDLRIEYEVAYMKRTGRIPGPQTPEFYYRWAADEDDDD
jgi:hypothetical protein